MIFKIAICGLARKLQSESLLFQSLVYLEIANKQLQHFITYKQEIYQETENSDDDDDMSSLNVGELPFKFSQYSVCWPTTAMAQGMYGQLQKFVSSFRKEIKALNIVDFNEIKEEIYVGNEAENSFYLGKEVEIDEISFDREASDDELDLNPDFIEEQSENENIKPISAVNITQPKPEEQKTTSNFFDPFQIAAKTPKIATEMKQPDESHPLQHESPLKDPQYGN